eukprot:CAMPEP_0194311134 /NCGR_PEP_ID=MMETSP0171-20130528/8123_1 /TAXON_ID=218684 /ORGANISM="Corethron pennatum, Strain L29A3" /LENGTH=686 /DNA_ID=CAMNT_0039065117 /DNA_START=62 /DNA_END=2122 /DNA_ORIENTATION=-
MSKISAFSRSRKVATNKNGNSNAQSSHVLFPHKNPDRGWLTRPTIVVLFSVLLLVSSFYCFRNIPSYSSVLEHQQAPQGHHRDTRNSLRKTFSATNVEGPIHDIAIVGAGPGGLTAALFGARAGLHVIVLGSETGLLAETQHLDNFPSFSNWGSGPSWLKATKEQATHFGAQFATPGVFATKMALPGEEGATTAGQGVFSLLTTSQAAHEQQVHAWSVIVATGATPRRLKLANETLLWGKSLHNCAICDGYLYLDKTVLVVGGGDSALDAANLLARYAKRVYLVHRRLEFSGNNQMAIEVAQSTANIEVMKPFRVQQWIFDSNHPQLTGASIKNTDTSEESFLLVDGAFVMIGAAPNTEWLQGVVSLDEEGLVQLRSATQSSVPGIFAAGEVADNIYKQAITASAAGAQAAIDAERWLRETRGVHRHVEVPTTSHPESNKEEEKRAARSGAWPPVDTHEKHCPLTKKGCIQSIVRKYPVVVFSKTGCPYCRRALESLSVAGVTDPHIIDLSSNKNAPQIQATLEEMTGRRTVPNVFIGGKSVGGGDETVALQAQDKLVPLLLKSGAIAPTLPNNEEACKLQEQACIEEIIQKYPVVMFSLAWCPECHRLLELLSSIGAATPHILDLDEYKPISQDIRHHLLTLTGRSEVPNLFIGGKYFGGMRQTTQMHKNGQLITTLHEIGWPMN